MLPPDIVRAVWSERSMVKWSEGEGGETMTQLHTCVHGFSNFSAATYYVSRARKYGARLMKIEGTFFRNLKLKVARSTISTRLFSDKLFSRRFSITRCNYHAELRIELFVCIGRVCIAHRMEINVLMVGLSR
jgi:hypothetical protein